MKAQRKLWAFFFCPPPSTHVLSCVAPCLPEPVDAIIAAWRARGMSRQILLAAACCASVCIAGLLAVVCVASGSVLPPSPLLVVGSLFGVGFALSAALVLALRWTEATWPRHRS